MSYKFANPYRATRSYKPGSPIGVGALGAADTSCGTGGIYDPKATVLLPNGTRLTGQCIYPGMPGYDALKNPADSGSGVTDALIKIGGGLLGGLFGSKQPAQPQYPTYQPPQSETPSWVMPVAIVGVGAVAAFLLTRK